MDGCIRIFFDTDGDFKEDKKHKLILSRCGQTSRCTQICTRLQGEAVWYQKVLEID